MNRIKVETKCWNSDKFHPNVIKRSLFYRLFLWSTPSMLDMFHIQVGCLQNQRTLQTSYNALQLQDCLTLFLQQVNTLCSLNLAENCLHSLALSIQQEVQLAVKQNQHLIHFVRQIFRTIVQLLPIQISMFF